MNIYHRLGEVAQGAMQLYKDRVSGYNRLARKLASNGVTQVTTRLEIENTSYWIPDKGGPGFGRQLSAVDYFLVIQPDGTQITPKKIKLGSAYDDVFYPLRLQVSHANGRALKKIRSYETALKKNGISVVGSLSSK